MYSLIRTIIDHPPERMIEIDKETKAFARSIDKKQNPGAYVNGVKYANVDIILQATSHERMDGTYLSRKLSSFISEIPRTNSMLWICHANPYVVGGVKGLHSIAVFVSRDYYFIYDANYTDGRAKYFDSPDKVVLELRDCLFSNLGLRAPARIPLQMDLIQADQLTTKRREVFVEDSKVDSSQMDVETSPPQDASWYGSISSYVSSWTSFFSQSPQSTNQCEADNRQELASLPTAASNKYAM